MYKIVIVTPSKHLISIQIPKLQPIATPNSLMTFLFQSLLVLVFILIQSWGQTTLGNPVQQITLWTFCAVLRLVCRLRIHWTKCRIVYPTCKKLKTNYSHVFSIRESERPNWVLSECLTKLPFLKNLRIVTTCNSNLNSFVRATLWRGMRLRPSSWTLRGRALRWELICLLVNSKKRKGFHSWGNRLRASSTRGSWLESRKCTRDRGGSGIRFSRLKQSK